MKYKAEFFDDTFEVFDAENDGLAMYHACQLETEKGCVLEAVHELDNDYNEVRQIF
jgi:hypothetical protein